MNSKWASNFIFFKFTLDNCCYEPIFLQKKGRSFNDDGFGGKVKSWHQHGNALQLAVIHYYNSIFVIDVNQFTFDNNTEIISIFYSVPLRSIKLNKEIRMLISMSDDMLVLCQWRCFHLIFFISPICVYHHNRRPITPEMVFRLKHLERQKNIQ